MVRAILAAITMVAYNATSKELGDCCRRRTII